MNWIVELGSRLSPWAWSAAVCLAVAAGILVGGPPRIDRLRAARSVDPTGWRRVAATALVGRSHSAIGARQRLLLGVGVGLALGAAGSAWLGVAAWPVGLGAGGVTVMVMGWFEPAAVRRRRWLSVVQAPQALELLAAGLSAGLPLRSATAAVIDACPGPVAEDLARVQHLIALGTGELEAWRTLRGHPQLGVVALDLARSVESGTRLVAALTAHAADARTARRAAIEVAARKVGVRSILPLMTCFIPAFLLLGVVPTVASALTEAFRTL